MTEAASTGVLTETEATNETEVLDGLGQDTDLDDDTRQAITGTILRRLRDHTAP